MDSKILGQSSLPDAPATLPPETTDWTFVVQHGCVQCGFTQGVIDPLRAAARVRDAVEIWQAVLQQAGASVRSHPSTWSAVEYACHVRDLCRLAPARLALIASFDEPTFQDWDQDAAAVSGAYWAQNARDVAEELTGWALAAAATFDALPARQWDRVGIRSDGVKFSARFFGAHFVHEVEHHLWDVGGVREDSW